MKSIPNSGPWVRGPKAFSFPTMYPGVVCPASSTPRFTASWISNGGTTAPAGDTSILSRPPEVFSIVDTNSLAASSGNTPSGQAVCIFHRIGARAVAGVGVVYEPATKASRPTTRVSTSANLNGMSLRMSFPPERPFRFELFSTNNRRETSRRESRQGGRACQGPASTQNFGYRGRPRRSEVTVTNPDQGGTVTRASLREYAAVQRERYQHARRAEKHQLLDELVTVTGMHRKAAIRLLRRAPRPPTGPSRAGRPRRY